MSLPIMTFSLQAQQVVHLPLMAASVRTLVVSLEGGGGEEAR